MLSINIYIFRITELHIYFKMNVKIGYLLDIGYHSHVSDPFHDPFHDPLVILELIHCNKIETANNVLQP